jgi:CRISPR-associated endonuclease/helicase Cas3
MALSLYPYQERVKAIIQGGKSAILQAPTGAGKTRAALAPFIEAFFEQPPEAFPRKCLYSVPMRVLANQFNAEFTELAASYRRRHRQVLEVGIQTGDRPDDPKLENNLIFTTVDQTLSNFLNIPYALGTASANLNAGAVLSSYLVFDELHLYDPDTMLPSVLGMLRWLRGVTPFIVMTATFSTQMLGRLANLLGAVVVPEDQSARKAMETIGSQVGKQRTFQPCDAPLTASEVLNPDRHGRRVICICNTVARAQQLYQALKDELAARGDGETQLCLIHSRFYKTDRDEKEKWIQEQFRDPQQEYAWPPLILIATQVIEVGVDATCDVLHTELAPAASLLQRAGRCARRENEHGRVFVYLPRDDNGEPDYTPYFLKGQPRKTERGKRLCEATWAALAEPQFQNTHMSFTLEQALIDAVHTPVDGEILDGIEDNRRGWLDDALRAMQGQERGLAGDLIRDAPTRFVLIHPDPQSDERLCRNPWRYDGFSLYPGTLAKAFKTLSEGADPETPWVMRQALPLEQGVKDEELPGRRVTEYDWANVSEGKDVFSAIAVAIHPRLAQYDSEVGFRFGLSETEAVVLHERPGRRRTDNYTYHRETYAEHIAGLYRAYTQSGVDLDTKRMLLAIADEVAYALRQFETSGNVGSVKLDTVIRAVMACHDLGKLSKDWQAWAHKWQKQLSAFHGGANMALPSNYMAAHTDFDGSKKQREAQRKLGRRPNHAGESAIAAAELLWEVCGENKPLWQAAVTTIARHHLAATGDYRPYASHPAAKRAFTEALTAVGLDPAWAEKVWWSPDGKEGLQPRLVDFTPSAVQGVLLYFLLSRILRLADQRSQSE